MSDEKRNNEVFAQNERRTARNMKIIVAMFGAVILLIFLSIVVE
jgi:hypothetical protein